jgi:putative ABC transport system substrate-binding protein
MERRSLISGLVAMMVTPRYAVAQQAPSKIARIGYVSLRAGPSELDQAFRDGLQQLGYIEGQNIDVDYRWANWASDRLTSFAADLVVRKVDVIVSAGGAATTMAVKKVVKAIPIVFTSGDPVKAGIVARLDRPGGNLTGVALITTELNAKRLELLTTIVPNASDIVVLIDPTVPTAASMAQDIESASRSLRVNVNFLRARTPNEIDRAFWTLRDAPARALLVGAHPMFLEERQRIVRLALDRRLPAMFEQREFAEAGGLASYGADFADMYRRLASYVDRILKGAKPGDLPIEQPTKFELIINLKTAKALGLTIPPSLLLRADHVIE